MYRHTPAARASQPRTNRPCILAPSFRGTREPAAWRRGSVCLDKRLRERTGTMTSLGESDGEMARLGHLGH